MIVIDGIEYVPKDSILIFRLADWILKLFGARDFMDLWMTICSRKKKRVYHNPKVDPRSPEARWLRRHEGEHVRQQTTYRWGPKVWILHYIVSADFRWEQEREAFLVNLIDGDVDLVKVAQSLSSWKYLWCVNQSHAETWFKTQLLAHAQSSA